MKQVIFAIIIANTFLVNATWIDRKAEGWAWYEEKPNEEDKALNDNEIMLTPSEIVENGKKLQQEKLAKAILKPTVENIADYIEEQKKWTDRANEFALNWKKAILLNPHLDRTPEFSVSHYGSKVRNKISSEKREQLITTLSKSNGLFFFYRGEDIQSKAFSRIVKEFARKYSWSVIACSIDGNALSEFPDSKKGREVADAIGLEVVPALIVVNPDSEKLTPIAYGMIAVDEIERNIEIQFEDATHD